MLIKVLRFTWHKHWSKLFIYRQSAAPLQMPPRVACPPNTTPLAMPLTTKMITKMVQW